MRRLKLFVRFEFARLRLLLSSVEAGPHGGPTMGPVGRFHMRFLSPTGFVNVLLFLLLCWLPSKPHCESLAHDLAPGSLFGWLLALANWVDSSLLVRCLSIWD